ncbi:MAG: fatty acid desaturase [Gemmatimonadaceae bacterium]|nr:fatty acid desaturase [Gloeobacterales cyanobacterium ES-bin-141]
MSNAISRVKANSAYSENSYLGLAVAAIVLISWWTSLLATLLVDTAKIPVLIIAAVMLVRAFLHTGLFITAHDAMHGTVFHQNRRINDWVGYSTSLTYAFLNYKNLLKKHYLHHRSPASKDDPDFCEGKGMFIWYLTFMKGYLSGPECLMMLVGVNLTFCVLTLIFHIQPINLLLFWLLPIVLSSLQMFYFGIYLPHRRPREGYTNRHRADSSRYSPFWSFVSCYHFGYHWEHHEYPHIPWYQLPSARRSLKVGLSRLHVPRTVAAQRLYSP